MSFSEFFPVYNKLSPADQQLLNDNAVLHTVPQGTILHQGTEDCMGLLLVRSGQLRAYISSDEGRQITLYRLLEQDICLFTATCIMNSIQFDIMICAEKQTQFWLIPPLLYKSLMERNVQIANYTNQIMSARFTDVMWLIEQVMWKSFDKRLAAFLLEESALEGSPVLTLTHEKIADHLGSAREVVTRMLKHFQQEGAVALSRGTLTITDPKWLTNLSE